MTKSTTQRLLGLVAAGALIGAAVVSAPDANASPQSYIADLESSPWQFTGPAASYVAVGYGVCHRLQAGFSQYELVTWVIGNTGAGIYAPQAAYIVESAEVHLCGAGSGGGRTA